MTLIKEIVHTTDVQVSNNSSFLHAIQTMKKNKHGVIVTVENNLPTGILTERDIVSLIKEQVDYEQSISLFTKKALITVKHNRSLEYALHILIENNIRKLIVLDESGFFVGIVTQEDILKFLEEDSYRTNMVVSEILTKTKKIITIPESATVLTAIEEMNNNYIGSIVIVDENNKPSGIFTERDTINIVNNEVDLNSNICAVMSKPVITVEQNLQVKDLISFMSKNNIRRTVVMNGDTIEGFVSFRDIAHNLKGKYAQILENKLRNIKSTLNHIGESVLEIYEDNNNHIIQWANHTALQHFGTKVIDTAIEELIDPQEWIKIQEKLQREGTCDKHKVKINSLYFEMLCSYHYINGKETILLILRDVTKFENKISTEKNKRQELEKELNLLQSVIDQQETIIVVSDLEDIIEVNKSFLDFFNIADIEGFIKKYQKLEETFIAHKDFYSQGDSTNWIEDIQKLPQYKKVVSIVDPKTIEPKAFTIQINPLDAQEKYYVITLTDITKIKLESQKHYYNATHDSLTSLHNRAYFLDNLNMILSEAGRYGTENSIILFDIDHFKLFNDSYGHLKGDEVLKAVAKVTAANIRKSDVIARWGGEEFIVLLPNTSIATAELVAENLRKQIESIDISGIDKNITSSFGVSEYQNGDDHDSLVKRADDALYEAKDGGRNCVISK